MNKRAWAAAALLSGGLAVAGAVQGPLAGAGRGHPAASGDILCVAVAEVNFGACFDNPLPPNPPVIGAAA